MIARIWKGAVRTSDGDAYVDYIHRTGVAGYTADAGQSRPRRATTRSSRAHPTPADEHAWAYLPVQISFGA
jgi:hypothetical protein